jgi:hypothetical protein
MKETHHQHEEASSNRNARSPLFPILLWGMAVSVVLASALVGVSYWQRDSTTSTSDPYATVTFLPKVTYDSSDVTISNTQEEPYLDTSLIIYVDATLYRLQIGTIRPGETIKHSLRSLTNERGERFSLEAPRTSELEVRARFGGYDTHKDFPPPP